MADTYIDTRTVKVERPRSPDDTYRLDIVARPHILGLLQIICKSHLQKIHFAVAFEQSNTKLDYLYRPAHYLLVSDDRFRLWRSAEFAEL